MSRVLGFSAPCTFPNGAFPLAAEFWAGRSLPAPEDVTPGTGKQFQVRVIAAFAPAALTATRRTATPGPRVRGQSCGLDRAYKARARVPDPDP